MINWPVLFIGVVWETSRKKWQLNYSIFVSCPVFIFLTHQCHSNVQHLSCWEAKIQYGDFSYGKTMNRKTIWGRSLVTGHFFPFLPNVIRHFHKLVWVFIFQEQKPANIIHIIYIRWLKVCHYLLVKIQTQSSSKMFIINCHNFAFLLFACCLLAQPNSNNVCERWRNCSPSLWVRLE